MRSCDCTVKKYEYVLPNLIDQNKPYPIAHPILYIQLPIVLARSASANSLPPLISWLPCPHISYNPHLHPYPLLKHRRLLLLQLSLPRPISPLP